MATDNLRKYLDVVTYNDPVLLESKILSESIYNDFKRVGTLLKEAKLTEPEIEQLFGNIETNLSQGGQNRTFIGKTTDVVGGVAKAVSNAFSNVSNYISRSGPVSGADALFDQLTAKIQKAAGGQAGPVMQAIYKYRAFAKKHPIMQGAIYGILLALAGISGAGLGGAAIIGGVKMADKLLLGNKLSSSLWSGFVTGAAAYGAGQLGQYLQGQHGAATSPGTTPDVSGSSTPMPVGEPSSITVQQGDTLSQIAKAHGTTVPELAKLNPQITNVHNLPVGAQIQLPPNIGAPNPYGVNPNLLGVNRTVAQSMNPYALREMNIKVRKMPFGEMIDQEAITWKKLIDESIGVNSDNKTIYLTQKGIHHIFTVMEDYQNQFWSKVDEAKQRPAFLDRITQRQTTAGQTQAAPAADTTQAGQPTQQIGQADMGPGRDDLPNELRPTRPGNDKGFWGALKDMGRQFTTKITKEKLLTNWKVAKSPTDTNALYDFLLSQKIPAEVINDVYTQNKIELPPQAQAQAQDIEQPEITEPYYGGEEQTEPDTTGEISGTELDTASGNTTSNIGEPADAGEAKMTPQQIVDALKKVWEPIISNQNNPIGNPIVRAYVKDMYMKMGGTRVQESRNMLKQWLDESRPKKTKPIIKKS